jgi:Ca2+-dependent lipid-binding protein
MDEEMFGIVYKFLVFTFVYFIGRWNFSINWLFPIFITTVQDYFNRKRNVKKNSTRTALQLCESDRVLSRLDDVPAWVLFPDFEKAEWMNQMLKQLWPKINRFVERTVRNFQPLLQQQKILQSFRFIKIDLGNVVPHVTGIKVYDKNILVDEIIMDINLCYFGDCEMSFTLNGIGGGLKDLETEGAMRIILKPLVDRLPFVSSIQIYFLKHPTINYELTMGLSSLDMFVTGDLIRSLIKEQISLLMVYPNKIQIDIDKNIPYAPHEMPDIQCVVRVKIDTVRDINESELFAVVELGGDSHKTLGVNVDEEHMATFNYACDLISYRGGDDEVHIIINRKSENKEVKIAK